MSEIEVKIRDDKAMLYTPYNPEFVELNNPNAA